MFRPLPLVANNTVGAARRMISSLRSDEAGVSAVENLCLTRTNTRKQHPLLQSPAVFVNVDFLERINHKGIGQILGICRLKLAATKR